MPDFERIFRKIELDLAPTPEAKAYVAGKHAGLDRARKEVLVVVGLIALGGIAALVLVTVMPELRGLP